MISNHCFLCSMAISATTTFQMFSIELWSYWSRQWWCQQVFLVWPQGGGGWVVPGWRMADCCPPAASSGCWTPDWHPDAPRPTPRCPRRADWSENRAKGSGVGWRGSQNRWHISHIQSIQQVVNVICDSPWCRALWGCWAYTWDRCSVRSATGPHTFYERRVCRDT